MSDDDKKKNIDNRKHVSTEPEQETNPSNDEANTGRSLISFSQKDDQSREPLSSVSLKQGPKIAAKPKKPEIRSSTSHTGKPTVHQRNSDNEKPGFSKSFKRESISTKANRNSVAAKDDQKILVKTVPGKSLLKDSDDENVEASSRPKNYTAKKKVAEGPSTRRVREPFDSFDREKYLAELIDYDRSSEEKKQDSEPDSTLRRRFHTNNEFNSTSSLEWEEEEIDEDSAGSATMRGSYRMTQNADDERPVILAEIINMGKLKELKDQRDSNNGFLNNRRDDKTIDEVKGSKTTGTGSRHVEEVKYGENAGDDDDDNAQVKHRSTITKIFSIAQRVERKKDSKESEKNSKESEKDENKDDKPKPPPEPEVQELEAKKTWVFPITETSPDIPGEDQPLQENRRITIGKRNKKIRNIGINTDISRQSKIKTLPSKSEGGDIEADYAGKGLRHVGQTTENRPNQRKNYKHKVELDDVPVDIGYSDGRIREVGVNTKVLPKTRIPPIAEMIEHKNGQFRDVGTNTDKPFWPIDDGTNVIYMKPFRTDTKKMDKQIVDPPPYSGPYKMPTKGERRSYYKGCEYHFPGRTGWRRLFYNRTHGNYELRRPSFWIYTLVFSILYILFVIIFSMAWFDFIKDDASRKAPVIKMAQPFISFTPFGPRTNPKAVSYDPRNSTEIMEKYAGIMALLEKYGDHGQNPRFGTCTADEKFGYPSGEPCVFLKVNRIIGFKTEPYINSDDLVHAKIDEVEFTTLKRLLENTTSEGRLNRTWITCRADKDKKVLIEFHPEPAIRTEYTDIDEKIEYDANEGIRSFFGPNDLNRIVALKIKKLKANDRVHINCKMWAHNIHHKKEGYGQVSFFVLLATNENRERVEKLLRHGDSL
ncbi:uncharacterized protein LOC26525990 [Drosophila erecta]|uniref:Uncharacterized protein n=1 Tax=Drosophila erecta TaxID=7220 RepID=A0A0Q5WLT7_DROER|nr:uncharacterized protein LOC26525990 [Drosophila erecta]KQS70218.1 uncharacterized protein Dere_GG26166 [Drosophila erecta]